MQFDPETCKTQAMPVDAEFDGKSKSKSKLLQEAKGKDNQRSSRRSLFAQSPSEKANASSRSRGNSSRGNKSMLVPGRSTRNSMKGSQSRNSGANSVKMNLSS